MFCLKTETDSAWADAVVSDLDGVIVDHAHCEMKAASNALGLAARHPDNPAIVRALVALAAEEIEHFQTVFALIERRNLTLGTPRIDAYAADLRRIAGELPRGKAGGVVDRLLIAALIEARSAERFKLIIGALKKSGTEPELLSMYEAFFPQEARHYRVYVDLAIAAAHGDEGAVYERLESLADCEAKVVRRLAKSDARASMHG